MKVALYRFLLGWILLLLPSAFLLAQSQGTPPVLTMQVLARTPGAEGENSFQPLLAEDALRSGNEIQIRLKARQDAYVYVIAYTSSRSALLLSPVSGEAKDALLRANSERVIPGRDKSLTLDDRAGPASFYAVASTAPLGSLSSLLVRMEAAGDDHRAVTAAVRERFSDVAAVTFQLLGKQAASTEFSARASGGSSASTNSEASISARTSADPQLDVEAMECLYTWLSEKNPGGTSISPDATLDEAPGEGAAIGTGGCALALAVLAEEGGAGSMAAAEAAATAVPLPPPAAESGAGGAEAVPAAAGASAAEDVVAIAPSKVPLQPAAASVGLGTSVGSGADPLKDVAQSPPLAPPVADLLAALAAPETVPTAPVRSIDVNSDGNLSSAVVLVVTPATTGTGVLLDYAGHVLANWHVVRGYSSVSITFKASDGASPSAARTHSAQVVRLSKTADLALLRIDNPPEGVTPVRIAKMNEIRNGDIVHAVGHPETGNWAYTLGKIDQVKPGSSWYAGHNLLHRGTVILAELPDNPGSAGAPLFNNALELVGIGATPRSSRGVLTGVSMETIRQFLQAPPAEARASTDG